MDKKFFILILFVLFLSMSIVSASEIEDVNVTSVSNESTREVVEDINFLESDNFGESGVVQVSSQEFVQSDDDVIVVNNWDELQYYCSLSDKDYTLKLKENTNFYPTDPDKPSYKIIINNNVKIIGSEGAYFGDVCQRNAYIKNGHYVVDDAKAIAYTAIIVPDNNRKGITLENITFKWIYTLYQPDGVFLQMGGKSKNVIKNCIFENINTMYGHSCIVYLKKGDALLENCSFVNCTTDFGCVSLYDPNSYTSARMTVKDCYFENNFARTEPGCINNCAILTVYNTTFYNNRAGVWAGAIHTHFYASATIYDSNFTDNVAGWNGGALYTYSYLNIYNTVFSGNNCTTNNGGGAIGACKHVSSPHIYIENSLFEKNENLCWALDELSTSGTGRGGAISLMDEGSLEVRNTTFISNAASLGTAICAIEAGSYGSPGVIIVNNTFINHTRAGDVLRIRLAGTISNISDNVYIGNSIEFSNLTLTTLNVGKEQSTLQINASLTNPSYYDSDILEKTLYDVYVNNNYVKTVNSTVFTLDFGDLDICNVYVIPTISNRKSNEVTLISSREYIFVSKKNGNDTNNGSSRDAPVSTIKRALELAQTCQNIILLDGDYSESNVQINYDVCIKGEGNATLTGETSFTSSSIFILKNLKINNLNTDTFIKQNSNNLFISNCIITNNNALLVHNNGFTTIVDSILLNNSGVLQGNGNYVLDYNWWGSSAPDLNINKYAILNITGDVDALENNQRANVKAVFYLNDGSKYTKLPEINFDITAVNGVVNKNITAIDSNIIYTLTAFSDGILTINYNDFTLNKTFEFLKSNPSISITVDDIMFGDNLTITVNLPNDVEGNLTVNVGNISQSKLIESPKTVFTFTNLKAGTYEIFANYSGDKKYQSKTTTDSVNVDKYQSTTNLNISTINVGEDVILIITTTNSSTGTITLSINNNTQTLTLSKSKANYTIKNIKRGDYLITAVYNGDDKYLTSQDFKFIEVDNLNATMTIEAEDITYGETAIIKASLNDDATGEVFVTIDGITNSSKVINGKADIAFFNLDAGLNKSISVFYSGDDTYFNKTGSANFTINKAELTFDISSESVKIGQDIVIHIKVPAKTSGTFTINEETMNIPLSGVISYVLSDLEIGNYTYTATYNGNNYNTVSKDTSFEVSEYPTPQWANEGGNIQNTHKSPYETTTNGEIAFTIPFNQTLNGEMLIDSEGNLYLTTQEGVYCFNQTNQLWNFTSTDVMGNFSGICIGRDVIAAPKSGDTLYFINQSNGEKYGSSNIYQGSSIFAPVIDSDANLYITSEYQYSSQDYKLTIVPYKLWETGSNPTLITIGNTQPLCSPTLDENIIVIVSDNRLRMIDAKTLQTISIKQGNYLPVRPVIGEGSVVYTVLSDSIVAYNVNGVQVWKTKVIGGVGNTLAIDTEQAVYHINAKGLLYKYDIIDGAQSKVSNLKVTSGLLIGSDGTLYFGSNNIFYAMDSEGNILWKSDLKSKIIGNPVMDKNGLIYTVTEEGIVALTYAPLKDPNIIINVSDVYIGEDVVVNVAIDNQILGDFSIVFNGETYKNIYTKVFSNLEVGEYSVDVVFDGDTRFMAKTVTANFTVSKYDSNLTVSTSNIFVGESLVFDINIAGDVTGNIILNLNNQNYTAKDN
uniref:Ig-like domain repeat protein n=1 Tax=Methanobrevibacter sp. TaxID=66852 RepID=UPI00386C2F29